MSLPTNPLPLSIALYSVRLIGPLKFSLHGLLFSLFYLRHVSAVRFSSVILSHFCEDIPWFFAIWLMIDKTSFLRPNLNAIESVIYWFADPQRIIWHTVSRLDNLFIMVVNSFIDLSCLTALSEL